MIWWGCGGGFAAPAPPPLGRSGGPKAPPDLPRNNIPDLDTGQQISTWTFTNGSATTTPTIGYFAMLKLNAKAC